MRGLQVSSSPRRMSAMAFLSGACMCQRGGTRMSAVSPRSPEPVSRRSVLALGIGVLVGAVGGANGAHARTLPKSREEIMKDIRQSKSEDEMFAEKEARAEERRQRLEKQRQLSEDAERKKLEGGAVAESEIDANLRANYYFPIARKRYLPKIKTCSDKIDDMRVALRDGKWNVVSDFLDGAADNANSALKLYASSLAGQGLSLRVQYVEEMQTQAATYERKLKELSKAVKRRKDAEALQAFEAMNDALQRYRKVARINTPDGGVGELSMGKRSGSGFGTTAY